MKYRIMGLAFIVVLVLSALFVPMAVKSDSKRVHQHLTSAGSLPMVTIDTGGTEIPGRPAADGTEFAGEAVSGAAIDNGAGGYYTLAADGETTIPAQITVRDEVSSQIRIRVRGDSSRQFAKSSYDIRLVKEDGTNNPQELMGMDAHHEWALHGPYLDKTLLRNYFCYNLAGEIMDYAPDVRFCEVTLNGEYQGVYLMTETLTAGKNGGRLPLAVNKKNKTYSGYLLRLDNWEGGEKDAGALDNFTMYAMWTSQRIEVIYPGKLNRTPEIMRSIKDDFSAFEKALYSYDYDSKKYGYQNHIDVDSFIDYFLINELTGNEDVGGKSTYIYKDVDGLYRMCVWDFNNAFDNFQETEISYQGFFMPEVVWYTMLMKDEDFTERLVERYFMLRESWFDEAYLMDYIDSTAAFLTDVSERNLEVWGEEFFDTEGEKLYTWREVGDREEETSRLKEWLRLRLAWMDENIDSLYQYSAESAVKKFNTTPE